MIKKIFILFIIIIFSNLHAYDNYVNKIFNAIEDNDINYIKYVLENDIQSLKSRLPKDYENNLEGATPLLYAIYNDKKDIIKLFIDNIDTSYLKDRDDKKYNSIMYAAAFSDIDTLKLIAEKSPSLVNSETEFRVNILHIASSHNNYEVIEYICTNFNIDINSRDIDGWTALYHAANSQSIESYRLLIKLGADTQITDNNGMYPSTRLRELVMMKYNELSDIDRELFEAIRDNDIKKLKKSIENGANINAEDGYGLSALHFAIKNKNIKAVDVLLDCDNINLEATLPNGYYTALDNFSREAVYIGGATPLLYAIFKSNGDSRIVNRLIKKNANINTYDEEGWNSFLYAAAFGNVRIMNSLVDKNENLINSKTKKNVTALHMAVVYDNIKVISYLVKRLHVDINAKDNDGWTALYYAAANNKAEAYNLLIELGADREIANNEGLKPDDIFFNN
ncbi:ankyrin repeat domain-containing protein [Brachyspira pilosicoli]|uniref:ankyrin repeat domain-containing protein n=1 Tax=Brachyspira pilosicoli TaxID=52584 RepID=UPI0026651BE8|nr:ankyrin repeat domain-containing protein [Brachyspira pilosicoli]